MEDSGGGGVLVYDQTERVILFTLMPFYLLGTFGSVSIITAVTFLPKLRKPRHIFQALGLLNSLVGVLIGIYGLAFLLNRAGYLGITSDEQMTWMLYAFIFHRYLLMLGDALPSLDRCAAVLFPLRYLTCNSAFRALAICLSIIFLAIIMTILALLGSTVPTYALSTSVAPFGLFYLLTSKKFALLLSAPYLSMATIVTVCDITSLIVAVRKGSGRKDSDSSTASRSRSSKSSSFFARSSTKYEEKSCVKKEKLIKWSVSSVEGGSKECETGLLPNRELRISIRCLAATLWFFLNQMCTFLPGVVLYGCEDIKSGTIQSECGDVTKVWFRLIILIFYQTQFAKPLFYCVMDNELAKGVRKFWAKIICG